ncbi:transcriptional regulator [Fodinisporobacter ferrooxydans]|uniref:HTH-type transcriptional regulator n=1 Tax=Fodinisporobacter ferrooxydans TaxID=2901836 RepID=A0ABY4CMK4_9BACL|nr:transcriptional regulator [Alicyclobacillaceae bacterium MYW30-H2]
MEQKERLTEYRNQVIEAIAQTMDLYGATTSSGRLYGILFFEDHPLTLDEMKERMGMSKSSMSYAVRALEKSKMVERISADHSRKDQFQAESNFFDAFRNFFIDKLQFEIDVMTTAIQDVIPKLKEMILDWELDEDIRRLALQDLKKLHHAEEYYDWLQQFVEQLQSGEVFHYFKEKPKIRTGKQNQMP